MNIHRLLLLLLVYISNAVVAQEAPDKETQLKELIAKHNTFILGTVNEVAIRDDVSVSDNKKWSIVVDIEEVLRGEKAENKQWQIFVHSPTQEFGAYKSMDDLKAKKCIWALTIHDGKVTAADAAFQFQKFTDEDVKLLRKLLKESTEKK